MAQSTLKRKKLAAIEEPSNDGWGEWRVHSNLPPQTRLHIKVIEDSSLSVEDVDVLTRGMFSQKATFGVVRSRMNKEKRELILLLAYNPQRNTIDLKLGSMALELVYDTHQIRYALDEEEYEVFYKLREHFEASDFRTNTDDPKQSGGGKLFS